MLTQTMISLYRDYFHARQDVFATRWTNGQGYSPQCQNQFTETCQISKKKNPCRECHSQIWTEVTDSVILKHLYGKKIHGFYPLLADGSCRFAAVDFDCHELIDVLDFRENLLNKGFQSYPATSTSKGWHLYLFFAESVPAEQVRTLLRAVMLECKIKEAEIFPKQNETSNLGNLIRTPMSIPDVRKGRCAFLKPGNWHNTFDENEQWPYLEKAERYSLVDLNSALEDLNILLNLPAPKKERSHKLKDWILPAKGNFQLVIENCQAIKNIVDKKEDMNHEERTILLAFALHAKNGISVLIEVCAQNSNFGISEEAISRFIRAIAYAKQRNEKPFTCKRLKELGFCDPERRCLEKRQPREMATLPESQWPDPSPIRFAFL